MTDRKKTSNLAASHHGWLAALGWYTGLHTDHAAPKQPHRRRLNQQIAIGTGAVRQCRVAWQ